VEKTRPPWGFSDGIASAHRIHARTNASLRDTFDQMTAGPSEPLLSSTMDHISLYLYIRGVTHAAISGVGDSTGRHALVKGFEQPRGHKGRGKGTSLIVERLSGPTGTEKGTSLSIASLAPKPLASSAYVRVPKGTFLILAALWGSWRA